MKSMGCSRLGGACEKEFHENTFEEIAELSKQHGIEMYQYGDTAHLEAMQIMQELMKTRKKCVGGLRPNGKSLMICPISDPLAECQTPSILLAGKATLSPVLR